MTSKKTLEKKSQLITQFGLTPTNTSQSNITVPVLYGDQYYHKPFYFNFLHVSNTPHDFITHIIREAYAAGFNDSKTHCQEAIATALNISPLTKDDVNNLIETKLSEYHHEVLDAINNRVREL